MVNLTHVARSFVLGAVTMAACATLAAAVIPATGHASLFVRTATGDAYEADTGLTIEDCQAASLSIRDYINELGETVSVKAGDTVFCQFSN